MSLTDVGKSGAMRSNPALNTGDALPEAARMAHATEGIAYRAEEATATPSVIVKDDQIFVTNGEKVMILIGRLPDGSYGVVIVDEDTEVSDVVS